ncbi:MAG: hypothetical protein GY861_14150 [bacterium]|nr:hypothetical protein [bacterium]
MMRTSYVIYVILALLSGLFIGIYFSSWDKFNDAFYLVSLTDIIEVFFMVVIAVYLTVFANIKSGLALQKKQLIQKLLSELYRVVDYMYEKGVEYMDTGSFDGTNAILASHREGGHKIGILQSLKKNKNVKELENIDIEDLKNMYADYKRIITMDPFKTENPRYESSQIIAFEKSYTELTTKIYDYQIILCC